MAINRETLRLSRELRILIRDTENEAVRSLVRAWATAWQEIETEWSLAVQDLLAVTPGQWPTRAQIARAARAQQALDLALTRLDELSDFAGVLIERAGADAVHRAVEWQPRIIASQLPPSVGDAALLAGTFDRISADAIDAIIERAATQIHSTRRPLSADAVDAMKRSLIRGVAVGENPRKAAAQMLARVQGDFNGGLTRALTIARTEILDAYRSGAAAAQLANEDVLQGWVWQAQLDTRTCPSCWAQHGSKHALTELGPNDHQNGRCARLPVTKPWRDLGIDLDEPESQLPDARTTFEALPRADQLTIMGPTRLAALDNGAPWVGLTQRRTTKGWRDSWHPRPASLLARSTFHEV